jgi:hypothetical protein
MRTFHPAPWWAPWLMALAVILLLVTSCLETTEPETPCDENHPDWPECHEQGGGNGGQ